MKIFNIFFFESFHVLYQSASLCLALFPPLFSTYFSWGDCVPPSSSPTPKVLKSMSFGSLLAGKDQTAHVGLTFSPASPPPAAYISAGIVRLNINSVDWAQFSLMDLVWTCVCVCVCACVYYSVACYVSLYGYMYLKSNVFEF